VLQATLALAQRVERMEIEFCALLARAGEAGGGAALEVGAGMAVGAAPGSPMNKVLGLGLGCSVTDEDLDAIELFYDDRECPIQIELCPLVSTDLVAKLQARGYVLKGFENELACTMPSIMPPSHGARVETLIGDRDEDVWLRVTSEGFAVPDASSVTEPPSMETIATVGGIMRQFIHPDITRYLAWIDGEPASAAVSALSNGVLGIFGTATRPAYRRRGLQSDILGRVLQDAVGRADLAIATTEPGSISQRTFERFGFQVLYTRAILVRS